ncbi:Four-jointed box protein 1 [Mactra antiquata]
MRVWTSLTMTGIGFTLGLLCGLLIHLPAETLPASSFEGPHLSRSRRVAQVGTERDPNNSGQWRVNSNNVNAVYDNSLGSADKQNIQEVLVNTDYVALNGENLDQNGYKVIKNEKSPQLNVLNKFPSRNYDDSVVYVNPEYQKLVLNNNVNNENDTNLVKGPYVDGLQLDNNVQLNNNEKLAHPEDVAKGQTGRNIDKIEIGNYRGVSISSGNDVTNGVYWSESVEQLCPKGFSDIDHKNWQSKIANEKFVKMNEGCGRMQNRMLTFQNSEKACARYRLNIDQIQGEIYSYYLSKLLGINNVAPSTLQLADSNTNLWRMVGPDVANAMWSEEKPVILSKFIGGLSPAYIPVEFRNLSKTFLPDSVVQNTVKLGDKIFNGQGGSSLCDLLQWSDLIVFDYLTANLDRVVNNLFNLQWNPRMMSKPAHNLEQGTSGNLVFLDNESGLFHGYRLLDKYNTYHHSLLNSLCVFKKQTIDKIKHYLVTDSISDSLQSIFENNEPLHRHVPRIPGKNMKTLKSRMNDILQQVQKCESLIR